MNNPAHNIRKDRIRLIRAMYRANDILNKRCCSNNEQRGAILNITESIRNNRDAALSISQEQSMCVSYARKPEDKYNTNRRVRTTLGKYLVRNFPEHKDVLTQSIIDVFVANVWSILEANNINARFLCGQDVIDYYRSSPSDSCMTRHNCDKVKLYSINPDKVCLVVYDEVRALLWTCDDGAKVLDRAYPAGHAKIMILREWAKSKGYILRDSPDKLVDGSHVELSDGNNHEVTLCDTDIYPYCDTFVFGRRESSSNIILSNDNRRSEFTLRQTDGSDGSGRLCCSCEERNDDGRSVDGDYYCDSCYCENFSSCENCGEDYHHDSNDIRYVENSGYYCNHCYDKFYVDCIECSSDIEKEDVICDRDGQGYCERCCERLLTFCEGCEEYYQHNRFDACPCGYSVDEDEDKEDEDLFNGLKVGDIYLKNGVVIVIEKLCNRCGNNKSPHAHGSFDNIDFVENVAKLENYNSFAVVENSIDSQSGLKIGDRFFNGKTYVITHIGYRCCPLHNPEITTICIDTGETVIYTDNVFSYYGVTRYEPVHNFVPTPTNVLIQIEPV